MADTTVLTQAQIDAAADAGAVRVVTVTDTATRTVRGSTFVLYFSDANAPGGVAPWLRITNGAFVFEAPLGSVAGAGAGNAITGAERQALVAILKKLHVGLVNP